jgi:hypothetical protein
VAGMAAANEFSSRSASPSSRLTASAALSGDCDCSVSRSLQYEQELISQLKVLALVRSSGCVGHVHLCMVQPMPTQSRMHSAQLTQMLLAALSVRNQ